MRTVALTLLLAQVLPALASAQDPQEAQEPKRLPAKVLQSWKRFEKQVQKNRELYDKANEKALAGFQRELERMNPPVEVGDLVRQFQQEAIVQLDVDARPPAPPPPDQDIVVFNGHRYKLVEEQLSWDDAKKRCEEMGGHLVVIDDRNEQKFLGKNVEAWFKKNPKLPADTDPWIGIYRHAGKQWMNVLGTEQVFNQWWGVEPRHTHVRFDSDKNAWSTSGPEVKRFFICEWDK